MKTKIRLLVILSTLFTTPNNIFAQIADLKKNQIKLSPVRTFDPFNPGIELSYERLFTNSFSAQLSAAYLTDLFNQTEYLNIQGYRVGIEGKYFFTKKKKRIIRPYFSGELIKYNSNIKFEEPDYRSPGPNDTVHYETYKMNKSMLMLNAKFGFELLLKAAVIDISAGIGLKYKNVFYIGNNNYESVLFQFDKDEGKQYTICIPINIKLGVGF